MGCKIVEVSNKRTFRADLSPKLAEVPLAHVIAIGESTNAEAAILCQRLRTPHDELGASFTGLEDPA
jgi:hypothetical protein